MPSLSSGSQFQQSVQTFALRAVDHKEVHAGRVSWIVKTLHKAGVYKTIQSFRDYLHVASYKSSDLLAGQECPRMPVKKDQQIEVTAVADQRSSGEQPPDLRRIGPFVGRCSNNSLSSSSRARNCYSGIGLLVFDSAVGYALVSLYPVARPYLCPFDHICRPAEKFAWVGSTVKRSSSYSGRWMVFARRVPYR
jgi:hypothetical protein